jgi:hypothetical protein
VSEKLKQFVRQPQRIESSWTTLGITLMRMALFVQIISFIAHPGRKGLDPALVPWVLWLMGLGAVCALIGWLADRRQAKQSKAKQITSRPGGGESG